MLSTNNLELVRGINRAGNLREGIGIRAFSIPLSSKNWRSRFQVRREVQLGIRSWEQSERSSTRSLRLDLKFGGAEIRCRQLEIRGSKFAAARNWKSAARFKAWEQLERASTRSLPVDLKFGDCI